MWAIGFSIFATALSAITFMAIPAKAYATDWSFSLINLGPILIAPVIAVLFIPKFRKMNIISGYQYIENRFNAVVSVFCSVSFILFHVGRIGIVLLLPSRSEEHTSELQSLMRISYAVFCLKKKNT